MNVLMIKFKFLSWNFGYDNKKILSHINDHSSFLRSGMMG